MLVAAAPSGARGTERVPGVDSLVAAVRRGDVEHAAAVATDMPAFAAPPNRAEWVRSLVMANARLFRQSPMAERPIVPPAMSRLGEVRVPTLILVGDRDSRDILASADSLAATIRNVQRLTLPGAGHLLNIWDPGAFDAAVRAFLTEGTR